MFDVRCHRVRQKTHSGNEARRDGGYNHPERRFPIVEHVFHPLHDPHFPKGQRASGHGRTADTALEQRLGVIGPLLPIHIPDDFLITGQFNVPAQKHIGHPQ